MVQISRTCRATLLGVFFATFTTASANACLFVLGDDGEVTTPALICPGAGMMGKPEIIDGVLDDAVEHAFGFGGGDGDVSPALAAAPAFAVFASGQWARVSHDGFDLSGPFFTGPGPSFSANDFSIIGSLDFNAAKHFGVEDRYGLNLGLFGGYTSTDVDFDAFLGGPVGNAVNEAGMFGAYGLFREGVNYVLASATTFIGETDVVNESLGSTGSYDTIGYAGTLSAGRIFMLSDTMRFDLRGGLLGVYFSGDAYTDSVGTSIGKSKISFGAVKVEPGVYSVHQLDNGMIVSPYARLELQQRFGYSNIGSVGGLEFEQDDADFSASLSGGVNLKVSESTTVSGEIRAKATADSTTLAGKIGLKFAF